MMERSLQGLIAYAQQQPWVTMVGTEGSANNDQTGADAWQDLDVTYFTADVAAFDFEDWCQAFGQPVMYQHTEQTNLFEATSNAWRIFLVQFAGFDRVDLKIAPIADLQTYLWADRLNTINWSREGEVAGQITDDHRHWVGIPTQTAVAAALNEFYWCAGNVVKALSRGQLLAANEMNNQNVRPELLRLLAWSVAATQTGQFNPGAGYRYLGARLPVVIQQQLRTSYQQHTLAASRQSLLSELMTMQWVQTQLVTTLGIQIPAYVTPRRQQLKQWLKLDV
ncbi:aminoglycoside 6-adenylyltransferase [Lactiplantibacillus carotarum]|uniref:aminoglycoside 6-adenylyltransferase n=1 Tax=Lactiplantibacillus carotarum TaxID=2993456 RepID=UPI00298F1642|nr:aminoglycoside 6-adenylyltransferase [Lactiplantibacillus carotarum]